MDNLNAWLLAAHSIARWLVVVFGLVAVGHALAGWIGSRPWTDSDGRYGRWFTMTVDLQLVLGLLLYVTAGWFRQIARSGAAHEVRFFAIEHLFGMIVAWVLVHLGVRSVKRAETDAARYRRAAIWFGVAFLVILAMIPWPFLAYGRPLFRLP